MRQIFLLLLLISVSGYSQIEKDSIEEKRVPSSFYFRSMFASLVSDGFNDKSGNQIAEKLKDRYTPNVEFGKSFGVLDIGLGVGKINTLIDTNNNLGQRPLLEAKLTMDACQYGIFSNEITIGAGYIFNSQTPVILELSSTIFAQIDDNWGIGVIYGAYELTGDNYDVSKTFTGIFLRWGLARDDGGFLLHRTRFTHKNTKTKVKVKHFKK
jgi:hypothetical protein